SVDVQKAATALLAAKEELEKSRVQLRVAREEADRAGIAAKKATDEAKATKDSLAVEVQKATDAVQASVRQKLDDMAGALTRAKKEYEERLAAQEDDHRRQLADARSGVLVPLTTGEVMARERASQVYSTGVELFFARKYPEAEATFERATKD